MYVTRSKRFSGDFIGQIRVNLSEIYLTRKCVNNVLWENPDGLRRVAPQTEKLFIAR